MGIVQKMLRGQTTGETDSPAKLLQFFHQLEGSEHFPLSLALSSLEAVSENAANPDDYLLCLLEDTVFSSLYVTFYEQIFSTIKTNPQLTVPLIETFAEDRDEREKVISIQTQNHVSFIEKGGNCKGCSSCDNHVDVSELVRYWENKDVAFYENLYVGMQTIQFAMEHLLYEVVPRNSYLIEELSAEKILKYRQEIFDFTAKYV